MALIKEIFRSVQGEGLDIGKECVFIRFAGCNRNCIWCDTDWTKGNDIELQDILDSVREAKVNYVVLTGGEPMIQDEEFLQKLTKELSIMSIRVGVETNGTVFVGEMKVDIMALSPKLKSSGRAFDEHEELGRLINNYNTFLKFVIADIEDMEEAYEVIETLIMNKGVDIPTIVFQPEESADNYLELPSLVDKVIGENKHSFDIRFIPQVHKLVGVR